MLNTGALFKKLLRPFVVVVSIAFCSSLASAQDNDAMTFSVLETPTAKIFLTTSTYGVMAGTLVGLASLAFYSAPGSNLRNVAIGASLGLYTGLILGAYVRYIVPGPDDRENGSRPDAPAAPGAQPAPPAPGGGVQPEAPDSGPQLDPEDPLGIGRGAYLLGPKVLPFVSLDTKQTFQLGLAYNF